MVFKNFSYLTVGSVLSQVLSLLTILKITRVLDPEDYGVFTFILTQGALLVFVGDLGLRYVVIRQIARDHQKSLDYTLNGVILRMAALSGLILIYCLYNYFFGFLNSFQLVIVFCYALIFLLGNIFEHTFLGYQNMFPPAAINFTYSLAWFALVFITPSRSITVTYLLQFFLLLNTLRGAALFFVLQNKKFLLGEIENFWVFSKKVLKESWPYFLLILVTLPLTRLPNNFLELNSTIEEVGYYNLSDRLVGPISLVLDLALAALFPNLASLWVKDKNQFNEYISNGFQYFMLLGLILCFLFTLFARDVVGLLFPAKFLPAVKVCQLHIWYLFLSSLDFLVGTILGAVNKEKTILKLGIVRSLIATPVIYFSSKYGALGLSAGFVVSFAVYEVYLWYIFKKTLEIQVAHEKGMWLLFCVLFGVSYFVITPDIWIFYRLLFAVTVVGGIAYFVFLTLKSRSI